MDIRLSPPREGTRGGREQFKWEDIKNCDNKEREHYLGHSVKIGTVKYKNHFYKHDWYLKNDNKATEGDPNEELQLIKLYEDELMLEMLGSKPKRLMLLKSRPTDVESLRKLVGDGEKPNLPSDGVRLEDTKLKQSNRHTSDCSQRMDAGKTVKKYRYDYRSRSRSRSYERRTYHRSSRSRPTSRHSGRRSRRSYSR